MKMKGSKHRVSNEVVANINGDSEMEETTIHVQVDITTYYPVSERPRMQKRLRRYADMVGKAISDNPEALVSWAKMISTVRKK